MCGWESGRGVHMRQELHDVEVALRQSKAKDYYKILGACTMGFIAVWC